MLETIGSSGYMHAVKLKPNPNTKNASRLMPSVSRDKWCRLLERESAGAGEGGAAVARGLDAAPCGFTNMLFGSSAAAVSLPYTPGPWMSNEVSTGG